MHRIIRKVLTGLLTAALVAGCVVAPALGASKKSHAFTVKDAGTLKGITAGGKLTGALFGPGTVSGTVEPPISKYVWHFKGGTVRVTWTAGLKGQVASGKFVITGGTGKYKGIKGKGSGTGNVITGKLAFKGTAAF